MQVIDIPLRDGPFRVCDLHQTVFTVIIIAVARAGIRFPIMYSFSLILFF